ncbi:MAG: hypothetical protein KC586_31200, partial [Myxococcales bacterium]|nr:hypothetical protein [Myxococcales bacterium]
MSEIYLHRDEIYKQVWERPMRQIAQDYGISDVGLKKACRRLGVPTPPVGFWAKREAGKRVRVPALPPLRGEARECVVIRPPEAVPDVGELPRPEVRVAKRLDNPHPIVRKTLEELKGASVDDYGRACPRNPKGLVVRVSPGQLSRAMRLVEGLVRALERLGAKVEMTPRYRDEVKAAAVIEGEPVDFSIWEPSGRKKVRIENRWSSYDRFTYTPHGRLELRIDEYVSSGRAKTIREQASKPIEAELGRFIQSMYATARVLKAQRLEREEEARRREERQRERERIE